MTFDFLPFIQYGSLVVGIVIGIYTLRGQIKKSKLDSEQKIISTITDNTNQKMQIVAAKVETIKTTVDKNAELFNMQFTSRGEIIKSIQSDIERIEKNILELEKLASQQGTTLEKEEPKLSEVRKEFFEFKARIMARLELLNGFKNKGAVQ